MAKFIIGSNYDRSRGMVNLSNIYNVGKLLFPFFKFSYIRGIKKKESNLLGVLFVAIVTIICGVYLYYVFSI